MEELKRELFKAQQRNLKLEASKAKSKAEHKKELKILEKKLQDEQKEVGRVKGEKKRLEFNLKERHKYLDKAFEEKKKLEEEAERRKGNPSEYCDRCDQLCREFQYIEVMMRRKDLLIKSLIEQPRHKDTKKLFEKSKAWSQKNLKNGPLDYVDMSD